jgi:hypothetical protein
MMMLIIAMPYLTTRRGLGTFPVLLMVPLSFLQLSDDKVIQRPGTKTYNEE